jgi:hypothetical protein
MVWAIKKNHTCGNDSGSTQDLAPSPKLSILKTATPTLEGRMIGCLIADGADAQLVAAIDKAATAMKVVNQDFQRQSLAE